MNQEMIEQYVAGRLRETEAIAFEEFCLLNPEFARQVEYEQRLKAGMVEVARGSTAEFVRANQPIRWNLAAAAGVLLAVIGMFYAWNQQSPSAAPAIMAAMTTEDQRAGPSLRLALVRGAESTPTLPDDRVHVEIIGLFDLGSHYSVTLERRGKDRKIDTVATLYSQHPTSPVTLDLMVDSNQLRPGAYSLRVRKQASNEDSLEFGFVKF
jgi:hypothetical protein